MKTETMMALDRINRRFYAESGDDFSATRQTAWPAWERVLDSYLGSRPGHHAPHSILDVGCGNGRFTAVLESTIEADWHWLGIDASLVLAHAARHRTAAAAPHRTRVAVADVVGSRTVIDAGRAQFDLVVAFGLLHHIPSWERRRSLLLELADLTAPGGMLAVSFWQFGSEPRFEARFLPWAASNEGASRGIDQNDLEPGDHLLRWGDGGAVRYCHHVDRVEASELTSATGLRRLETFRGDGASGLLNLYHLMQKPTE